jgi:hypothetical protein
MGANISTCTCTYSNPDRQSHNRKEELEDNQVIRIRKSKYRQHNGQTEQGQNTTQKTKDRAIPTPIKPVVNSCAPEG